MRVKTYKEETHAKRDCKAQVKTGKRLNEGLMKIVNEVIYRINSFGMNVCFVCEMMPNYWNVFSSQAKVRHIHKSLTKIENGEECYMTPREVTSGEHPEYVFAPIPCFDMPKL